MRKSTSILCSIIRGGTSKGVFLLRSDLPLKLKERNRIILSVFGSPNSRQIDGLGGANPLTSKLAIIAPAKKNDIDIEYTFGQVGIDTAEINYNLMCGNIASGAALYAVRHKFVENKGKKTIVRILNTNTNKVIIAHVLMKKPADIGAETEIILEFMEPSGMISGSLFPTGKIIQDIPLEGGLNVQATIIDAGNVYALINALDLGLMGTETLLELEMNKEMFRKIELLKSHITEILRKSMRQIIVPKIAMLSKPTNKKADVRGIIFSNERIHKAYAVTGGINTAAVLCMKKSIADNMGIKIKKPLEKIRIAHPSGIMEIKIDYDIVGQQFFLKRALISRTARVIMEGEVFLGNNYDI